jgi:hypothetical protein
MGTATYFVRTRGRVTGPFDRETLQKLVRRGAVSRVHEVSADRVNWSSAGEYEDLFPTPMAGVPVAVAPRPASEPAQAVGGAAGATPGRPDAPPDPLPGVATQQPPVPAPPRPSRLIADLGAEPRFASPPLHPPGQNDPATSYKGLALAALVTGICGVPLFGLITGVLAMAFAVLALTGMRRTGNETGKGMALAGFILGLIDFLGWLIYLDVMTSFFR